MVKILGKNGNKYIVEISEEQFEDLEDIEDIENPKFKPLDEKGMKELLDYFAK